MVEVKLTEKAYQQLKQSAQWWANNHSSAQALQWYEGFLRALLSLEKNPERFQFAPESAALSIELRELHYGLGRRKTHRALFAIRTDSVVVYAIRHLAQQEITGDDL